MTTLSIPLKPTYDSDFKQSESPNWSMFGDNLKRRNSGRSPEPKVRKIARYGESSGYAANSNFERLNFSNPSSRRSSMSLQNGAEQAGYGTPQSRSPSTRNGHDAPALNNMETIPKALESFVLAVSNRNQTSQHLNNVQGDFESMAPKHADFPALKMQTTHRLNQARNENEIAEAQSAIAAKLLLDALKGHFPGQMGSASHQNCVSRTELDFLKEQLQEMKSENREMKKKLGLVDRRLEDETNSAQRSEQYAARRMAEAEALLKKTEDRMARIEEVNRATSKTISSAVENYKTLQDQTVKDRLSFRTRCSALEDYMDKSKTKHKEHAQAISGIQSTLNDHIGKSDGKHKEHTLKIDLTEAKINTLHRTLDVDVIPKMKENSDAATAAHKALKNLELQSKPLTNPQLPAAPAIVAPIPAIDELVSRVDIIAVKTDNNESRLDSIALKTDNTESRLGEVETKSDNHELRLDGIERAAESMTNENDYKDVMVGEMVAEVNTKLEEMQSNLGNNMRDIGKELADLDAWKDLQTHIQNLRSSLDDQDTSTKTKIEELGTNTSLYVDELRSATKQAVEELSLKTKTEVEELKSSSTYTSQLLDSHVDVLQRHEGRLNSVTTDELVRQMDNQWRGTYGAPDQLNGLTLRLGKLENFTRGTFKGLDPKVNALKEKVDGLAATAQARMAAIEEEVQSLRPMR